VQTAQGDLVAVLTSYQASHSLFERLAAADPGNAGWPRALASSFGRVAIAEAGQSARERALSQFQEGRNIITRLTRQSPENAILPEDLAWFESQIKAQER
jgi:hypothetical protein